MATTEQRTGFRLPWASEAGVGRAGDDASADAVDGPNDGPAAGLADPPADDVDAASTTLPASTDAWPTSDTSRPLPDLIDTSGEGEAVETEPADDAAAPAAAVEPTSRSRRDNPLVIGLVRVMREAAQTAREEAMARAAEAAKARIETLTTTGADGTASIRQASEHDLAEIREWSKAEVARIREETDERIASRRRRLELEIDEEARRVERRIGVVRDAVAAFESDMDAFFTTLLAEEDPARLVGLAEGLPAPPAFETIDDDPRWDTPDDLDAAGAAAAEAAARTEITGSDADADAAADQPTDPQVPDRVAQLSAPGADRGTGAAVTTQVSVAGLVSVASIAGFKRALGKVPGVTGVSVGSAPNGDFVFTVQHAPETDVGQAVTSFERFAATVGGSADGVISVTATDPDTNH